MAVASGKDLPASTQGERGTRGGLLYLSLRIHSSFFFFFPWINSFFSKLSHRIELQGSEELAGETYLHLVK